MKLTTLQPAHWPRPKGYANGVLGTGTFALLSGQIGWDADGRFVDGLVAQTAQALRNILAVLAEAGGRPEHIAQMTWYVVDMAGYRASQKEIGAVWRETMGRHYPAMSVVGVASLVEVQALIEIEAVAILSAAATSEPVPAPERFAPA
jgi:enamine deaminase RidA (YjgF/YER057c/UK114 family)